MITPDANAQTSAENFPQKKAPPKFDIWQTHVASRLGISPEELRKRRRKFLTQGEHFEKIGRQKLYCERGVELLRETLCVPVDQEEHDAIAAREQNAPGCGVTAQGKPLLLGYPSAGKLPGESEVIELIVCRAAPHIKNKYLILAHRPELGPGQAVRVRVSSNKNFLPGMKVPARLIQEPDFYECTKPAPRSPGRW